MKLIKTEILNFRSIKKETVDFEPACRVLVGINESGKSNILKSLSFLSNDYMPSRKDDVRESLPNEDEVKEARVKFFFRLDKVESEKVYSKVALNILTKQKDPNIVQYGEKLMGLKELCNLCNDVRYNIDLIQENKTFKHAAFDNSMTLCNNWKKLNKLEDTEITINNKKINLKNFTLINLDDFPEFSHSFFEDGKIESLQNIIGSALIEVAQSYLPQALFWNYDEKNLLPSEINIDEFAEDPDLCIPLKNMFFLAGILNIKGDIESKKELSNNQIQNYFDRIATKTTSHFRNVWKEYQNIEFKLRFDGDKIIPAIKEQNSFDFSKRSDGFKRFVTFLLMISVNVKTDKLTNTLLLIDEPDSSLHPSGARYLRDELIQISLKNYVVFSTHSIFMIDTGNIERHYLVKKQNEITSIESAKDSNIADEEVIFNALGYSVFEVLKEKNIIFEGWKDKKLFKTALAKSPSYIKHFFDNIGLCHAKGVKHIKTITPILELGKRMCLIISDSDTAAKEQQKLYKKDKGYGQWKIYQEVCSETQSITGEDYINNNYISKHVNKAIKDFGLPIFEDANIISNKGKLKEIDAWLRINGLNDQQAKDTLSVIKDGIFESITYKDIEETYNLLIEGIVKIMQ